MPGTFKTEAVVLRSIRFSEADCVLHLYTLERGRVGAIAKGVRKTKSRFGARLEPFTHVSLMVYRGRGSLDTVSQAEIVSPFRALRGDLGLFAAGETMLEAVDKVAEEHERNVRLFMLLLTGMRALDARPADPWLLGLPAELRRIEREGSARKDATRARVFSFSA